MLLGSPTQRTKAVEGYGHKAFTYIELANNLTWSTLTATNVCWNRRKAENIWFVDVGPVLEIVLEDDTMQMCFQESAEETFEVEIGNGLQDSF